MNSLAPRLVRTGLDAAYLGVGLVTSVLAFGVWVACVTASLSLAVFIVGLPVMLLSAYAFRATAELDRHNAALVLGRPLRGRYRNHYSEGFFGRLRATLTDPQTWKDLLWLVAHSVIGFGFGVVAVSLVASVLGLAVLPLWYWAIPDGVQIGLWTVDTLWEALVTAPLALPLGLLTAALLRGMARVHAALARSLLA
jgi:hypothetical protein